MACACEVHWHFVALIIYNSSEYKEINECKLIMKCETKYFTTLTFVNLG